MPFNDSKLLPYDWACKVQKVPNKVHNIFEKNL